MTTKLKSLALILLSLSLASCGGDSKSESPKSNEQEQASPNINDGENPAPAPPVTADPGDDSPPEPTPPVDTDASRKLEDYQPTTSFFNQLDPLIGSGYESDFAHFNSVRCLNGRTELGDAGGASININQSLTYADIEQRLTFKTGLSVGKINLASSEFLSTLRETERTLSAVTSASYEFDTERFVPEGEEILTPIAQQAHNDYGGHGLRRLCGNQLVAQVTRASDLFVSAKFHFATTQQKQSFMLNIGPIPVIEKVVNFSSSIDALANINAGGVFVEITAHQTGGDSALLPGAILSSLDSSTMIACQDDGLSCIQLLTDINNAIARDVAPSLSSGVGEIRNIGFESLGNLIPSFFDGDSLDAYVNEDTKNRRQNLLERHEQAMDDKSLIEYSLARASISTSYFSDEINRLEVMSQSNAQNLTDLEDAVRICFEQPDSCNAEYTSETMAGITDIGAIPSINTTSSDIVIHNHAYGRRTNEIWCSIPYGSALTYIGASRNYRSFVLGYKTIHPQHGTLGQQNMVSCIRASDGRYTVSPGVSSLASVSHERQAADDEVIVAISHETTGGSMVRMQVDTASWDSDSRKSGQPILGSRFNVLEGHARAKPGDFISGFSLWHYDSSASYTTIESTHF
ncbi:hypothetical protein [Bacterioplanoides sp.]|uniref:hypothetical protein n=1 Tax=Bacterioplanoides sp. TaxID=2066072 RepID=UPI003B00711D